MQASGRFGEPDFEPRLESAAILIRAPDREHGDWFMPCQLRCIARNTRRADLDLSCGHGAGGEASDPGLRC